MRPISLWLDMTKKTRARIEAGVRRSEPPIGSGQTGGGGRRIGLA